MSKIFCPSVGLDLACRRSFLPPTYLPAHPPTLFPFSSLLSTPLEMYAFHVGNEAVLLSTFMCAPRSPFVREW